MTVRDLIDALQLMDEDIQDFEVGFVCRIQLTPEVRISGQCRDVTVPQNADIGAKRLWLKARIDL